MENENTEETQRIIPSFLRKPEQNSPMVTHKSLHVFRRSRIRRLREGNRELKMQQIKEVTTVKEVNVNGCECLVKEDGEEEDDDREEVESKIHALQRIVPGGESFGVDKLFDETAGYIVALQHQVKALKALAGFFEKLEKEKTKFGG
ncbi:transcription factor PAR1-like [Gastrolobium bilobum]|uniref:transcription factor PAR1-like n=1 Tax=Gastrolobium bilobum TaxID=150636 RepID=UPI002AB25D44|nr:transcription factor PAR1-like [Gastrolobium bilobum]